jgi:hypothetical protein
VIPVRLRPSIPLLMLDHNLPLTNLVIHQRIMHTELIRDNNPSMVMSMMMMVRMFLMITKRTSVTLPIQPAASGCAIPKTDAQPEGGVRILMVPCCLVVDGFAVVVMRWSRLATEIKRGRVGMEHFTCWAMGEALRCSCREDVGVAAGGEEAHVHTGLHLGHGGGGWVPGELWLVVVLLGGWF